MRYQDIYPSVPALNSSDLARRSAAELLTLEYFEAEPDTMPVATFNQHHILLNLNENPHRVENWRNGEHRDFTYQQYEVVVTPAGTSSGWKWHEKSKVIVVTLEPDKLAKFAKNELGLVLSEQQLIDQPQFVDQELVEAGKCLCDSLNANFGSAVMFESLARIFLVKLLERYAHQDETVEFAFSESFTPQHFERVLNYVADNYGSKITVEHMAQQAHVSPYHFSRLFKRTIGQSPYQFLMAYRVEKAKSLLTDSDLPMIDIALTCGFSDQAHFSRIFKKSIGQTPIAWRANA